MIFHDLHEGVPAVASGQLLLFSDFETQGPMWTGHGPREAQRRVEFARPFLAPPAVQVALSMWDIADGANQRGEVIATGTDATGFTAVFRTWGDTRVARVSVSWLAVGMASDEAYWDN